VNDMNGPHLSNRRDLEVEKTKRFEGRSNRPQMGNISEKVESLGKLRGGKERMI